MERSSIKFPSAHVLVDADIENIRRIAGFWSQHGNAIILNELADYALLVIAIAEDARTDRANFNAGRLQPLGNAVVTPRALVCDARLLVEIACAIRASLHTILTANAIGVVDDDNPILGLICRTGWTYLNASRMGAVVAQLGHEERLFHLRVPIAIGEAIFAFRAGGRNVHRIGLTVDASGLFALQGHVSLDPRAEVMRVQGNIIFLLACLDAAQAADAFGGIDAERPSMLGPVISWDCRVGRHFGCRCLRSGRRDSSCRYSTCRCCCRATCKSTSETAQKFSPPLLLAFELFLVFHLHVLLGNCLFGQVLFKSYLHVALA